MSPLAETTFVDDRARDRDSDGVVWGLVEVNGEVVMCGSKKDD
jgi:hypothetical protein